MFVVRFDLEGHIGKWYGKVLRKGCWPLGVKWGRKNDAATPATRRVPSSCDSFAYLHWTYRSTVWYVTQDNRKSSAGFRPMPSYEGVKSQCFIGTAQSLYNSSHSLCSIGNVGVPIGSKRVTFHVTWPHVGLYRSCFVIGITMRYIKNSYTGLST